MGVPNADKKILPFPEIVTRRSRLSPFDDFKLRTLSAVKGVWAKLLYMSELRLADGSYDHWGHIRAYGEKRSQEALAQVHSEIYLEVLRTPLRRLVPENSEEDGVGSEERTFLAGKSGVKMIPANPKGGSPRHFNSIVLAASLLEADRKAFCRRGA